ncbi:MAG: HAD-IA family hydrolase [Acidobacteria bacterium]|nr:HAD-IA family hydrolase [Acidobacteriota bacterium]
MDLIIFDLDGTLIDSRQDLVNAVNATRGHAGLASINEGTVSSYVGSGAPVLVRRVLGSEASEDQVEEGLEFFLEYYRDHMLDNTVLYPGVAGGLEALLAAGRQMAVLTNKPVRISKAILEGLGIARHFRQVYGGNSFDHKKPHPVGIRTLMAECAVAAERTLMVGDSSVDVLTARNAGVRSCGVTWGFQPETLFEHPPDILVDRMEQICDLALKDGLPFL